MKVRLLYLLIIPWLMAQCNSSEVSGQLVVEASITPGKPVENISVRFVNAQGLKYAKPVSDANVRLLSMGITYILNEIKDNPGHYAYYGLDLEIIPGQEYMLWVQHEAAVAVTSAVIKADTMVKGEVENGLGYFVAKH